MRKIIRFATLTLLLSLLPIAAFAQSHELAVTLGGNFPRNDQYNPSNSFAVGAQYDGRIFHVPMVSLYLDVPVVVATNSKFTYFAPITCAITDPNCNQINANYRTAYFTPGLKLKLTPPVFPIQPYVVAGVGLAHYNLSNNTSYGNSSVNKAAFEVGGGLDMKVFPHLSLRGEVRDFINGTPDLATITQSGHQHNLVPQVGLVLRF